MSKIYEIIKSNSSESGSELDDSTLASIIGSIRLTLPTPNIAMNKAQFEELGEAISSISDIMDILYNDDIISVEEDGAKDAFNSAKALIQSNLLRDLMHRIGASGMSQLENFSDIAPIDIINANRAAINLGRGIKMAEKALQGEEEDDY